MNKLRGEENIEVFKYWFVMNIIILIEVFLSNLEGKVVQSEGTQHQQQNVHWTYMEKY